MASQSCEVKRIQVNSSQQALDIAAQAQAQAKSDYLACLGPQEQSNAALKDAQPEIIRLAAESKELFNMNEVVLQLLGREAQAQDTIVDLARYTQQEGQTLQNEIDELKIAIRTERRKFLDGSPSVSPAVGGLYYTQTPDNKLLIAFLSCLGAFLLFVSVAILMNMVPLEYMRKLTSGERLKFVTLLWIVALCASWGALYLFT